MNKATTSQSRTTRAVSTSLVILLGIVWVLGLSHVITLPMVLIWIIPFTVIVGGALVILWTNGFFSE